MRRRVGGGRRIGDGGGLGGCRGDGRVGTRRLSQGLKLFMMLFKRELLGGLAHHGTLDLFVDLERINLAGLVGGQYQPHPLMVMVVVVLMVVVLMLVDEHFLVR